MKRPPEDQSYLNYRLEWDHDVQKGESRLFAFICKKLWWTLIPVVYTLFFSPLVFLGIVPWTIPATLVSLALALALPASRIEHISSESMTWGEFFQEAKGFASYLIRFRFLLGESRKTPEP